MSIKTTLFAVRHIIKKNNFDTHHHSKLLANSSLKFVLQFAEKSKKHGLLPANCRIMFFLSHCKPCCFIIGLQLYITTEIYYISECLLSVFIAKPVQDFTQHSRLYSYDDP